MQAREAVELDIKPTFFIAWLYWAHTTLRQLQIALFLTLTCLFWRWACLLFCYCLKMYIKQILDL